MCDEIDPPLRQSLTEGLLPEQRKLEVVVAVGYGDITTGLVKGVITGKGDTSAPGAAGGEVARAGWWCPS